MVENTKISWSGFTTNFWVGCVKKGIECERCYMYRDMAMNWKDPAKVVRTGPAVWNKPRRAQAEIAAGERAGLGRYCFTCSYSDFFNPEADPWRAEAWRVMIETPDVLYLVLTKLPNRIGIEFPDAGAWAQLRRHVAIGVSVGVRKSAWRIDAMMKSRMADAAFAFISAEPLLEEIEFAPHLRAHRGIRVVLVGGESDYENPRPMNPMWAEIVRQECIDDGAIFHFKQMGGGERIDGIFGGNKLFGKTYLSMPDPDEIAPVIARQEALEL